MSIAQATAAIFVAAAATIGASLLTPQEATPPPAPAPAGHTSAMRATAGTTYNWAGYVRRRSGTTDASAQWRVPPVSGRTKGATATWVGIDGLDSRYLAQVGTATDTLDGRPRTIAWWEMLTPTKTPPMQPLRLAVRPNDLVNASVSVHKGVARFTLRNLTTRRSVSVNAPYRGPGRSAEWIQEDVLVGNRYSPAIGWSRVAFSHVRRNNAKVVLDRNEAFDIVDGVGVRETRTSVPLASRDAFVVDRIATGHWTPVR